MAGRKEDGARASNSETPLPLLTADLMPKDFSISVDTYYRGGTDRFLLNPPTERRQSMKGFGEEYVDIIDWIVRITTRIWEEGGVGRIYDYYRHSAQVYHDSGVRYGRETVVSDTVAALNAFPDFRGLAEDIIWAGNDEVGFYTSHRARLIGHNTGYSQYGAPTGRRVVYWVLANCVSLADEIHLEWVLYNTSSVARQLGFDLFELARKLPPPDLSELQMPRVGEPARLPGLGKPPVLPPKTSPGFDVEDFIRRAYHDIWNWRLFNHLYTYYEPNVRVHGPTDREYYGVGAFRTFVLSTLTMFPDAAMYVDEIYWMGNDRDGYRTSVRWSLVGHHRGPGVYGEPTGAPVVMWGISQHYIRNGKIYEEFMLYNEFALIQQIVAAR